MTIRCRLSVHRWLQNFGLALGALLLTLACLETGFRQFGAVSDGWSYTLASELWFSRYWQPLNALGFRDTDHPGWQRRKLVFVIGDSFVAGHGIKDYRDRFTSVLGARLGEDWAVFNLGQCGTDSREELACADAVSDTLGRAPDVLVLGYFINDIMGVAREAGRYEYRLPPPPPSLRPLVAHSYLANFVFWRLYRFLNTDLCELYWDLPRACWQDAALRARHLAELQAIIDWAQAKQSRLAVVIFPHLAAVERSRVITEPVREFFAARGVPVLDLAPLLIGRDPAALMVNAADPHPSVAVHHEVGELLVPYVRGE